MSADLGAPGPIVYRPLLPVPVHHLKTKLHSGSGSVVRKNESPEGEILETAPKASQNFPRIWTSFRPSHGPRRRASNTVRTGNRLLLPTAQSHSRDAGISNPTTAVNIKGFSQCIHAHRRTL